MWICLSMFHLTSQQKRFLKYFSTKFILDNAHFSRQLWKGSCYILCSDCLVSHVFGPKNFKHMQTWKKQTITSYSLAFSVQNLIKNIMTSPRISQNLSVKKLVILGSCSLKICFCCAEMLAFSMYACMCVVGAEVSQMTWLLVCWRCNYASHANKAWFSLLWQICNITLSLQPYHIYDSKEASRKSVKI